MCNIWCKSVKLPGRSLKKYVCNILCIREKMVGGHGRGLYHKIQRNSVNVDIKFLNVQ